MYIEWTSTDLELAMPANAKHVDKRAEPKNESYPEGCLKDILGIGVGLWSSSLVENFPLTHLSLVNSLKDILLYIRRDIFLGFWLRATRSLDRYNDNGFPLSWQGQVINLLEVDNSMGAINLLSMSLQPYIQMWHEVCGRVR